jgi:hypothetical protein
MQGGMSVLASGTICWFSGVSDEIDVLDLEVERRVFSAPQAKCATERAVEGIEERFGATLHEVRHFVVNNYTYWHASP